MKFAKNEGKFHRYLILFSLITIVMLFVGTSNIYSYLIFIIMAVYGLKYIVKINIGLYDMLIILAMFALSLIIQWPIYTIFINVFNSLFITTMIYQTIKLIIVIILNDKLNKFYLKFKKLWDNNNFYIRYIFSVSLFLFVILSMLFLIIYILN